jgi:hypothetical protein
MKTKLFFILSLPFLLAGCAHGHYSVSCEDYCLASGGYCRYVEKGERRYNTTSGQFEERPTTYVCEYNR